MTAWGAVLAADLQQFDNCRLVASEANDGDSFIVRAGEREMHLRLYFVDCPESRVSTDADAKRVREQARYFGVTEMIKVLEFGREATKFMEMTLAKPFTVHTAFATALGRSPGGRVYGFVTTSDGRDIAGLLVANGYARVYGVRRPGPQGRAAEEIRRELEGLETQAMKKKAGIWAISDPDEMVKMRALEQREQLEMEQLRKELSGKKEASGPVDLNAASSGELQSVPGVGPVLASSIIAARPFRSVDDLLCVKGVGTKSFEKLRPYFIVREASPSR
jgi:DNA uptake protein ComE-like DNA-binding protein